MKTINTTEELTGDTVRQQVREHYGAIAERNLQGCGCDPTCCAPRDGEILNPEQPLTSPAYTRSPAGGTGWGEAAGPHAGEIAQRLGYSVADTKSVPDGANLGLGCGNPLAIASLRSGQTVLDLGSGAGFDAFLAARAVGPSGHVIGVDMTPAMVSKARANGAKGGYRNVDFRLGEIESLPVSDASVDVILSNCVINLSPDKPRVLREAFRVLRPGGRLAITDLVAVQPVPPAMHEDAQLYAACASGAAQVEEVRTWLRASGFTDIRITPKRESRAVIAEWFPGRGLEDHFASATIEAVKPAIA